MSEHPDRSLRLQASEFDAMMDLVFARRPFLPYPVLHASRQEAIARADSNMRLWREQLADRYTLDERIGRLTAPLLVLWGESDRVFDVSGAASIVGRLPQAQAEVLPGVGHLPMMEAPDASARAYRSFVRGISPSHRADLQLRHGTAAGLDGLTGNRPSGATGPQAMAGQCSGRPSRRLAREMA